VAVIRADLEMDDEGWEEVFARFAKGPRGSPPAYVFRCLHCGALTGYWDSD
jgi:uncharacterized protein CbrC (UPF0167 family)